MEVIKLNGKKIDDNVVAAIGFFDGVHLAHQVLINKAIEIGKKDKLKTAVITFDIHPKTVLFGLDYYYITPLEKKLEKIKTFDIDYVYLIEFDKEKAQLTPEVFIDYYIQNLHTLVCGFDFKFGVRGSGNVKTLKTKAPFRTVVVHEQTYEGYKIGSTHIRDLILSGQVGHIKETLGDYYAIRGEVVHGAKKGRLIGYPTANIDTDGYLIPKPGVYATMTKYNGEWFQSMTSIGHNPTLNCNVDLSVESYLFGFEKMIYGEIIETVFLHRLREEIKFDQIEALIAQIDEDGKNTKELLKTHEFYLQHH